MQKRSTVFPSLGETVSRKAEWGGAHDKKTVLPSVAKPLSVDILRMRNAAPGTAMPVGATVISKKDDKIWEWLDTATCGRSCKPAIIILSDFHESLVNG